MSAGDHLLGAAEKFCAAFVEGDIPKVLTYFSTTKPITVFEHGEPSIAPFLGRPFEGMEAIKKYFGIVGSLVGVEWVKFSDYVVDQEVRKVAMKGQGKFVWLSNQNKWEEYFVWVLDFDEETKVMRYQVWADTGGLYLAKIGKLGS